MYCISWLINDVHGIIVQTSDIGHSSQNMSTKCSIFIRFIDSTDLDLQCYDKTMIRGSLKLGYVTSYHVVCE